ncbi:hypothetical protein ES705_29365 [subsurface metagenome]
MMAKFRNAQSYYGNTAEARKRQRDNLIPGNTWQKRKTQEFRVGCFWEYTNFGSKQMIYENFENGRNIEGVDKKELKDEEYLDNWWENRLILEERKNIYKEIISWQEPKDRAEVLNYIGKCLKKKSAEWYGKPKKQGIGA